MRSSPRSPLFRIFWFSLLATLLIAPGCGASDTSLSPAPASGSAASAPAPASQESPPLQLVHAAGPELCGSAGAYCWAGGLGAAPSLHRVWGISASDLWIVGTRGTLLHWDGISWSQLPPGMLSADLHGIWGSAANDVWAVGDAGTVLHWNGSTWSVSAPVTASALYAVWGSSATAVWAVGAKGHVAKWDGSSWQLLPSGSTQPLYAVQGRGASDAWAVGVTDELTVGIWVGRPDGTPNPGFFGANTASPLLQEVLAVLPAPSSPSVRVQPASVSAAVTCWRASSSANAAALSMRCSTISCTPSSCARRSTTSPPRPDRKPERPPLRCQ